MWTLSYRIRNLVAEQLQVAIEVLRCLQAGAGCPAEGQGPRAAYIGGQDAAERGSDEQGVEQDQDNGGDAGRPGKKLVN